MKILPGGRNPRFEDSRSRAELSLLKGARQNKRSKIVKAQSIIKIISSAGSEDEAVRKLEPVIYKEIWSGSGKYRAVAYYRDADNAYYSDADEHVTVEHDGNYIVTKRDGRGQVLYLSIEPSLPKAVRTFFKMWQHGVHHGPLRL